MTEELLLFTVNESNFYDRKSRNTSNSYPFYKVTSPNYRQSSVSNQQTMFNFYLLNIVPVITFCPFQSPITAFISQLDYNSFLSSLISNLPMPIQVTKSFS